MAATAHFPRQRDWLLDAGSLLLHNMLISLLHLELCDLSLRLQSQVEGPSSLQSLGPALSPFAGSLIYLRWRASPHYRVAHRPITIHSEWRAHQVCVTKGKMPTSSWPFDCPDASSAKANKRSGEWVYEAEGDWLIITSRGSGTVKPALKSVPKVQGSVVELWQHFWALCGVAPLYFGGGACGSNPTCR